MMPEPGTRSNRQNCDGLLSCTTSLGRLVFPISQGGPVALSMAAMPNNPGIDVMCPHERTSGTRPCRAYPRFNPMTAACMSPRGSMRISRNPACCIQSPTAVDIVSRAHVLARAKDSKADNKPTEISHLAALEPIHEVVESDES